jgi:hypothetical protein
MNVVGSQGGRDQGLHGQCQQLIAAVPEYSFRSFIDSQNSTVLVHFENCVRSCFQQLAEALFGFAFVPYVGSWFGPWLVRPFALHSIGGFSETGALNVSDQRGNCNANPVAKSS